MKHLQISTSAAGHQVEMLHLDEPRHVEPIGQPHENFREALVQGSIVAGLMDTPLYSGGYMITGPNSPEVGKAWRYYRSSMGWEGDYGLDARWERRYATTVEPMSHFTGYVR